MITEVIARIASAFREKVDLLQSKISAIRSANCSPQQQGVRNRYTGCNYQNCTPKKICTKVSLYGLQNIHRPVSVHHVDGKSIFTESSCSSNPVQIRFTVCLAICINRKIKIDNNCDLFYIDTCTKQIEELELYSLRLNVFSSTKIESSSFHI